MLVGLMPLSPSPSLRVPLFAPLVEFSQIHHLKKEEQLCFDRRTERKKK